MELDREKGLKELVFIIMLFLTLMSVAGCKHEVPEPATANNGNNENGGGNGGNGGGNGIPCDPDIVYFDQQILPLLVSSCAKSNCHDDSNPADGISLNSYNDVMNGGDIDPDDPFDSDFWEVLNESDPDKQMPPPGEN